MGAEVLFAPIDRSMLMRARRAARNVSASEGEDDGTSAIDMLEEMGDAMSRALITEGAQDWRGVCLMADEGDEGAGEAMPFSAVNLAMALADPVTFEAFDAAYVVPFVTAEREREEPGNVLPVLQRGIGKAGTQDKGIASKSARQKAGGGATTARTSQKSRRPRQRKASGAS